MVYSYELNSQCKQTYSNSALCSAAHEAQHHKNTARAKLMRHSCLLATTWDSINRFSNAAGTHSLLSIRQRTASRAGKLQHDTRRRGANSRCI